MRRGTRGGGGRPAASHAHRPQHNIPRQLQPAHAAQSQIGPLMTGRLQGLKDIKMEIELLKREIIEEQILSNSYTQRNVYEQPMFSQTREDPHDDYPRLYDDLREFVQYEGREGSRKRPHFPVSENEAPAKRFSAPNRVFKKSFGSQLGLPPNYPCPDFQRPPEFRFPTSKPYKGPPVTEAMASGVARPPATANKLLLRADCKPSCLMFAWLETSLGAIMKKVRTANPQHELLFKQPHVTRAMKQCVRDRIRTAMIGKAVSAADEIESAYYDMFPDGSDNDVIMKGLQAQENKHFISVNTDNPEVFFKENMRNLILLRIEEITNTLQEIYGSGANTKSKLQIRQIDTKPKSNIDEPKADRSSKEETQAEAKPKTDGEPETAATQLKADDTTTVEATEEPTKNEPETQPKEPAPIEKAAIVSEKAPKELIDNKHYMALDKRLNFEMMQLINFHRFTREFTKNIEMDTMYQKTKATIIAETAKKLEQNSKCKSASNEEALDTSATANASTTQTPNDANESLPMLYYAKILGKPSLPKRKKLESFFSQFNPKSIKKHRTIRNLLFVGFVEKEPYEKILAADGTAIEGFNLDIKTARKNKNNQKNTNNSLINTEADKLKDLTEYIIDADFDQQVVDLLTSIINSEFDNFSEDIMMDEPPVTKNAVNKENRHSTKMEEVCDADQNSNHVTEDDVIELKDDDEDVIEIKDDTNNSSQNVKETINASQNGDETNNQWPNNRVAERANCHRPPAGRGPWHERVACTGGS